MDSAVSDKLGGNDCDDNNFYVNLGVLEIYGDGIENNCNGIIDETYVAQSVSAGSNHTCTLLSPEQKDENGLDGNFSLGKFSSMG